MALLLILVVLLTGCSILCPQWGQDLTSDQIEFSRAFDYFQSSQNTRELRNFKMTYPNSSWSERAGEIIRYAEQLEQQKRRVAQLKQQDEKNTYQLEVLRASEGRLAAEVERLIDENCQLHEKLEQLKGLLIQLEAQPQ